MGLSRKLNLKRRLGQLILIGLDFVLIFISFTAARYFRFHVVDLTIIQSGTFLWIFSTLFLFNYIFALYEPLTWRSRLFSPAKMLLSTLLVLGAVTFSIYILNLKVEDLIGRGVFVFTLSLYYFFSLICRYLIQKFFQSAVSKEKWILVINKDNQDIFQEQNKRNPLPGSFICISSEQVKTDKSILNEVALSDWTGIIVDGSADDELMQILMNIRLSGQPIHSFQSFFEAYWQKLPVKTLNPVWFTYSEGFSILQNSASIKLKRFFDIVLSLMLLILSFPIVSIGWVLIRLGSPGPGFYSQLRVGENGRLFRIWKLRTMKLDAEKEGSPQWTQKNDSRIIPFGRFLRKTRIDEFPQAINILRGEMSFIGPRPERPEFTQILQSKIPYYNLRHLLKPGLTGWAQIMYPYGADEKDAIEKLEYELYYIKNYSLALDFIILVRTILVVVYGRGR